MLAQLSQEPPKNTRSCLFSLNSKCFYLQVRAIEGLTGCAPLKHAIRFSLARNFAIVDALPGIEQKFIHKHVALLGKRILIWSVASVQLQPRSHLARAQNGLLCSERVTYSFQFTIDTTHDTAEMWRSTRQRPTAARRLRYFYPRFRKLKSPVRSYYLHLVAGICDKRTQHFLWKDC